MSNGRGGSFWVRTFSYSMVEAFSESEKVPSPSRPTRRIFSERDVQPSLSFARKLQAQHPSPPQPLPSLPAPFFFQNDHQHFHFMPLQTQLVHHPHTNFLPPPTLSNLPLQLMSTLNRVPLHHLPPSPKRYLLRLPSRINPPSSHRWPGKDHPEMVLRQVWSSYAQGESKRRWLGREGMDRSSGSR